jgi:hypothetical protein
VPSYATVAALVGGMTPGESQKPVRVEQGFLLPGRAPDIRLRGN